MKKYEIGTLISNELPIFPEPNEFHKELKTQVYAYFKRLGKDPKLPDLNTLYFKYTTIFVGLTSSYYYSLFPIFNSFITFILSSMVLGFFCAQIGLHPLHDSSHFSVTHSPLIWKILGATHDFFNGSSNLVWIYQHMLGHHPYTNIPNADPDISINDPDVRRILPTQEYLERYLGQENIVPFLYGLLALKTRFQDIKIVYFEGKNASIRINPLSTDQTLVFWGGKIFFVLYRIILPWLLIGFFRMSISLIISDLVSSYWLAITFQVNHVTSSVEYIEIPTETSKTTQLIPMDWAELQLKTTQDYAHDSIFWTSLTGGLNYQTVHHIFPNIHQSYYPELAKVCIKICKKFNIDYIVQVSFTFIFLIFHLYLYFNY